MHGLGEGFFTAAVVELIGPLHALPKVLGLKPWMVQV